MQVLDPFEIADNHAPCIRKNVRHDGDTTLVTLRATGRTPVRWSASTSAPWLYLSRSTGTLAPGESATVKVYVDHLREPSGFWSARLAISPAGTLVTIQGYGTAPTPSDPGRPTDPGTPSDPPPSSSDPDPTPTTPTPTPTDPTPTDPEPSDPPPSTDPSTPGPTDPTGPSDTTPPADGSGEPSPTDS